MCHLAQAGSGSWHLGRSWSSAHVAVLLAGVGCGSTVGPVGLAPGRSAAADGGGGPASQTGGLTVPRVGSSGSQPDSSTGSAFGGPTGAAGIGAGSGAVAPTGPMAGVGRTGDSGPIKVGVVRTLNADSALAKYGGAGLAFGDQKTATESYLDWINAHGGIGGRRLQPVFFDYDYNTKDPATEYQRACTYLTEDQHVAVAFGLLASILPVMVTCMEQHHTPFIYASTQPLSKSTTSRVPGMTYTPTLPSLERTALMLADGLASSRFFTPATKVGIFRMNIPDYADVTEHVLRPALAKLRVPVVDEETFDQSNQQQDVGNAVLRFRAAGVNTVLFLSNANAPFFFIPAATSQGYFPAYGFTSTNAPELQAENFPAQALRGSMVVGLNRYEDVDSGGRPVPSSQRRCARIFLRAGGSYPSGVSYITVNGWCDLFFFFRAIADAAARSGRIDLSTLLAAK